MAGHKIFISYKYADSSVKKLNQGRTIVRDYVNVIEEKMDKSNNLYFKGEPDDYDLSHYSVETIKEKLKDRIRDSTLTIVLISPGMKDMSVPENEQWIPWEISYSLKEIARKDSQGNMVTSSTNGLMAIVLPDLNGNYDYFLNFNNCCSSGCLSYNNQRVFKIIAKNIFNIKKPTINKCNYSNVYISPYGFAYICKWDDFLSNMNYHIENAYDRLREKDLYEIYKEID